MVQQEILKKMLDFQKSMFDSSFNSMSNMQEQSEKVFNVFLSQANWLPAEGKKAISDWIIAYKKGRDALKESVDNNYGKVENFFACKPK